MVTSKDRWPSWLWRQVKVFLTQFPGHESGVGSSPTLFNYFFVFFWGGFLLGIFFDLGRDSRMVMENGKGKWEGSSIF